MPLQERSFIFKAHNFKDLHRFLHQLLRLRNLQWNVSNGTIFSLVTKKCNQSNAELLKEAFLCCPAVSLHTSSHQQKEYPHLSTAPHTEQKHQMYTSIKPYILFALTAFQQLLFPMQMSRLSPTPNCGEAIWAAEYKWLGMIDRPSHSSPSTDR